MIHTAQRNHRRGTRRLGTTWSPAQQATWARGNCPPGLVQNADACIDPASYEGICPPNTQGYGPGGGFLTFAEQQAGQFTCGPIAPVTAAIQSPQQLVAAQTQPPPPPAPTMAPPPAPVAIPVTPAPVVPVASPAPTPAAPVNYSSAEITGSFPYVADIETVQQEMYQYGDTWDNAQSIVNGLYASGIVPGTVTPAMALSKLTAITATGVTAPASVLTSPSTWPWYYWAALAGGGFFLFAGGKGK